MGCQFSTPIDGEMSPEQSRGTVMDTKPLRGGSQNHGMQSGKIHDNHRDLDTTQDETTTEASDLSPDPFRTLQTTHLSAHPHRQRTTPPQPHPHAALWHALGQHFWKHGYHSEGEELVRLTLAPRTNATEEDRLQAAQTLVAILEERHKWAEAEPWTRQILHETQDKYGSTHPKALQATERYALVLHRQGKIDPAEVWYRFVLLHRPPDDNLISAYHLARLLTDKGCHAEAEVWWRKALPQARTHWGPQHPDTLYAQSHLAALLVDEDPDEAEALWHHTLQARVETRGMTHPDTVQTQKDLADLFHRQTRLDEAQVLYQQIVRSYQETLGQDHTKTIAARELLADLLMEQEDWAAATPVLEQSWLSLCRVDGSQAPRTVTCQHMLARTHLYRSEWDRAAVLLHESVDQLSRLHGSHAPIALQALSELATAHAHLGHLSEAHALWLQVASHQARDLGVNHPTTHESWVQLQRVRQQRVLEEMRVARSFATV